MASLSATAYVRLVMQLPAKVTELYPKITIEVKAYTVINHDALMKKHGRFAADVIHGLYITDKINISDEGLISWKY